MDFHDKVIIVTGASSGIGEATARLFTKKGAKVTLVARSKEKLDLLSKELPGSFVAVTDMAKEEEIKDMVKKVYEHFGRIDILINNAGQGYDAKVEHINSKTIHKIFDLDLVGPILAMQQVIPIMRAQREGSIVNVSSGTALMILPSMSPYASLKQALAKVSLTAREELEKDTIHVSVIYPYITDTDFEKNTLKDIPEEADFEDGRKLPPADPPVFVAEKILEVIEKNTAEAYAHDWMKPKK